MRKFVCGFLCLVLLFALMPAVFAEEADVKITNTEDFLNFAQRCRLDSYSQGLTVSLEADVDLNGTDFAGIPIFSGTFYGNGHTISGLEITGHGSEKGLFRYLTQTAAVQQLHVTGKVVPQGSRSNIGGIAGCNAGVIENCSFSGEISGVDCVGGIVGSNTVSGRLENCRTEGSVHGSHFVGGIAGSNAGVIRTCENVAYINTTPQQNSVDISDITLGTITGTESVNTVTDIGGIAGSSSGTVRDCVNRGDVGYKHMGYNIGGIAGSQTGYLMECENYAAVSGRKEVGGIVGQMEPSILLSYETDTLQILSAQMEILGALTDRAVLNAQNNTANVRGLMMGLENHIASAEAAIDILTIDPENPELEDRDTYIAAFQTLSSSFAGIDNTLRSLNQAIKDTGDDLNHDLQAIADQMDVINGILDSGEENLGGSVSDVSDADTAEDLTSKIESAVNCGPVLGDWNVGGIVGAIALENDIDPEEDVKISGQITLNAASKLRSVVLGCVNNAAVTVKKQNAGGIVGWQSMGLVKDCINTGALEVSASSYVGGIAGQSLGYIRASYVKCEIAGDDHVGGIAGSGTVVTACRSMVRITGSEKVGAILGFAEENNTNVQQPIFENFYICVEGEPGAIDGISYASVAQSMELDSFMALDGLPEMFKTVSITFISEDGTETVISITPGSALEESVIPDVPKKTGFFGRWDGLENADLENILFDMTFRLVYTSYGTTIESTQNRDGKPVLLVQGDFAPGSAITMIEQEAAPELAGSETLLESWQFVVSECENITAAHYLLPEDVDADRLQLYIRSNDGRWRNADYTVNGSYIVFVVNSGDDGIALARADGMILPWLLITVLTGAAIVMVVIVCVNCKKKAKKETDKEEDAHQDAAL